MFFLKMWTCLNTNTTVARNFFLNCTHSTPTDATSVDLALILMPPNALNNKIIILLQSEGIANICCLETHQLRITAVHEKIHGGMARAHHHSANN